MSAMVFTLAIASSKLLAIVPAAVPTPIIAVVAGSIFLPKLVETSPIFPNASPTFSSVILFSFAWFSNDFKAFSVAIISLCTALYCSSVASPFWNCSCTCASAVFRTSNLSFVSEIAFFNKVCFCANNSVFFGSNFNSLFTSFSSFCVLLAFLSTPDNAFSSLVVSPPNSIVIPLILPPLCFPTSSAPFLPVFFP